MNFANTEDARSQFIGKVRQEIQYIQQELTDDFSQEIPEDALPLEYETFEQAVHRVMNDFFYPFVDFLKEYRGGGFMSPFDEGIDNWNWMKEKYVELQKFVLEVFEPASKILDDAIRRNDFHDLVARFDAEVVPKFLH